MASLQGAHTIDIGSDVWVPDPEVAWIDGTVINIKGEEAEIETRNEKTVSSKLSKLYLKDASAPSRGVEDMTRLVYLHEPGILHNIGTRYELNEIYTYTGNILIAVNPFQNLAHLYDDKVMAQYKGKPLTELSPHVFAIAEAAYRAMINEKKSNSILVSGESGAGKTETTKMLMRYLAYLGGNSSGEGLSVERKVLESNPVLEAFGNAKTVRNNNSSRFGKFVEIQFDKNGRISGAAIRTYLLEKSRVCQISDPERNYHCFYFLCAAPPEVIEKYKLGNPNSFHYLNQSNCYQLVGVNEASEYLATRKAMDIVGISGQDQDAIFKIVAAILHLGNVGFAKDEKTDSSVIKDDKSKFHLQMTAELLMCDFQALEDALLKRVMVTRGERIKKSLDPAGSTISRDGLAKTIYSRLFDWLVEKINGSIGQDAKSTSLIGVLDIYGFESFQTNSFEQLCINFTNEKLQQHFNQHVFKMDQEEYTKEEISWSYIDFVDNEDVLDLIEKRPGGIISLLDEACMFPKATHETFTEKLYQTFSKHKRFIRPKLSRTDFTIVHYAGEVRYQSHLFLDKNKDYVVPEHQDLLSASKCYFVAALFPRVEEKAKTSKFSSIGSRFKQQLQQLMDILNSTKPHYIRCVKPNSVLKPGIYENFSVLQQLRSSGVLEAIKIKSGGFPSRMTFGDFLNRFAILAKDIVDESAEETVKCKTILDKMDISGYRIGKTKVFLRAAQMAELDARKSRVVRGSAQVILGLFKTNVSRKQFVLMRRASILVQTNWRGKVARKKRLQMRREKASINIQKNLRRLHAKKTYDEMKSSAIVMQSGFRAMSARNEFRSRTESRAARIIQAYWRGYSAFSYYKNLKRATHFMQCRWKRLKGLRFSYWPPEPEKLEASSVCETGANTLTHNERETVDRMIGEACSIIEENAIDDVARIRSLSAENKNLKALLYDERLRADALEVKYAEAHESSEKRRIKLKETDKRVKKLQVSLKRMIHTMSDQFSDLKTILHTPSKSFSTSGQIVKGDQVDEDSPTDIDHTSPSQALNSVNMSTLSSDALQVMVQDFTGVDVSGKQKRRSEKEGAFDDFF